MFEKRKLLLVEDDQHEIQSISKLLMTLKIAFHLASTVNEAINLISQQAFDFLLTDLHIETKAGIEHPDGLQVIKAAIAHQPNITIVATSSDPRSEIWNETMAAGAHHFIRKPLSKSDEIVIAFGLARDRRLFLSELAKASKPKKAIGRWKKYADDYPFGIIMADRELRMARMIAKKKDASFVIMGESGTGKEEVAKLIHRLRTDTEGAIPFIAVNCASITGNLAESLLFGHRKGAFTGADQSTSGYIGEADGGILFLDEIQVLDIPTQQKLLRVLNDGTYNRLGETKTNRSQFQLIAASTKDLDDEVELGNFLIDIRTRMMGLDMYLPPLRKKKEYIPALVALFLSKKGIAFDDTDFDVLVEKLQGFYWAGNIRQLFKALDAWLLTCEFDNLPLKAANFPVFRGMVAPKDHLETERKSLPSQYQDEADSIFSRMTKDSDFTELVDSFEKLILQLAIARHSSIGECSKAINLPRSTLDNRRRKFQI